MIVNITMGITLTLPDGSASMDGTGGRGWVLPDGNFVKLFTITELNDKSDMTYDDLMELGCDIDDFVISAEIGAD